MQRPVLVIFLVAGLVVVAAALEGLCSCAPRSSRRVVLVGECPAMEDWCWAFTDRGTKVRVTRDTANGDCVCRDRPGLLMSPCGACD